MEKYTLNFDEYMVEQTTLMEAELDEFLDGIEHEEFKLDESFIATVAGGFLLITLAGIMVHLLRSLVKQIQILKLIKKEKDPAKRVILKKKLKKETDDEINIRTKIKKIEKKSQKEKDKGFDPATVEKARKKIGKLQDKISKLEAERKSIEAEREQWEKDFGDVNEVNDLVSAVSDIEQMIWNAKDSKATRKWDKYSDDILSDNDAEFWSELDEPGLKQALDYAELLMKKYNID